MTIENINAKKFSARLKKNAEKLHTIEYWDSLIKVKECEV